MVSGQNGGNKLEQKMFNATVGRSRLMRVGNGARRCLFGDGNSKYMSGGRSDLNLGSQVGSHTAHDLTIYSF